MIFYHGTPISGSRDDARQFLTGRSGLVSFAHQNHLSVVRQCCLTYILDNGAYTIWRRGGKLNVREYIDWVTKYASDHNFNFALIPDIIDGSEADNDRLIEEWPKDVPGVPIWHLDESLPKLEALSYEYHTVALGSSGSYPNPGAPKWWNRMAEAMNMVCENGIPRCKLHGLRMMAPEIFTHLPLTSADSTNAAQNGCTTAKAYRFPETWQGCTAIAWKLEYFSAAPYWRGEPTQWGIFDEKTTKE